MPKAGSSYVRWSHKEIEAVCKRIAIVNIRTAAPITKALVRSVAAEGGHGYRARQEADYLPARAEKFLTENRTLIDGFITELRELGLGNAAEDPRTQADMQRMQAAASTPPPAAPADPAAEMTLGQIIDAALDRKINAALAAQSEYIFSRLEEVLKEVNGALRGAQYVAARRQESPPPPTIADAPARERKPQVLICGALPEQFQSVQKSFPDLDLRLFKDRMPAETNPDLVVAMTDFNSHSMTNGLRKKYGDAYCPVTGAASNIKRTIQARLGVAPKPFHAAAH